MYTFIKQTLQIIIPMQTQLRLVVAPMHNLDTELNPQLMEDKLQFRLPTNQ